MAETKTVNVETTNARASTTLTDTTPTVPLQDLPQGLMVVGPQVTLHFVEDAWNKANTYDYYDVVQVDGTSYIAVQDVPANIEITDTEYWAKWNDPNAQIALMQEAIANFQNALNGKAPTNHADPTSKYGVASNENYGHAIIASTLSDDNEGAVIGSDVANFINDNANNQGFGNHLWCRIVKQGDYNDPFKALSGNVTPQEGFSTYGYAYVDLYSGELFFDMAFKVTDTIEANTKILSTPFTQTSGSPINLGYLITRVSGTSNLNPGYELDLNEDGSIQCASQLTANTYYIRGFGSQFSVMPSTYNLRSYHDTEQMRTKIASYYTSEEGNYDYGSTQPNSLYPQNSGYCDCYSFIWHVFQQAFGWQLMTLIVQTGQCNGITIGRFSPGTPINEDLLKIGDIILWSSDNGTTFEHAVMYLGNSQYGEVSGRFGDVKMPVISTLNSNESMHGGTTSYGDLTRLRLVKRYLI